ncbi:clostripain-related cysteine peptidase [Bradyrhizobium sp. Cp5.3]|uniref:clostripain-related cysteine peptidase n=1 Tax=Bradyrhizobium sp. Cp5.3 TaxID=443598 RepID=UPI0004007BC4|nr:clostripain-related cysteine peptidase [Bradyrhizobium sp. Cp5.3]
MLKQCLFSLLALGLVLIHPSGAAETATGTAEWTIMVFMNAKNNLEADAIATFRDIASVGSTAKVNLVVEMGRPQRHYTSEAEGWSGVLRFLVKKGQKPIPSTAVADLRNSSGVSDLGSRRAFDDFVNWSVDKFPAKKYMLVIWNHGQGWRFQVADPSKKRVAIPEQLGGQSRSAMLAAASESVPKVGGYRAVSFDEETRSFLYISDVQQSVGSLAQKLDRKLDAIGFDAGMMAMIETAYAFRGSSTLMIASEESEPAAGWNYAAALAHLVANPAISPLELTNQIVVSYKDRYGDFHMTTLSVIDLTMIDAAAAAVSALADEISKVLEAERIRVEIARSTLVPYGAGIFTSIDLVAFLENYIATTSNPNTRSYAQIALDATKRTVLTNYASAFSAWNTGSRGIAIYFPASKYDFDDDFYKQGYVKENEDHVIDFVARERWSDFLQCYFRS